MKSDEVDNSLPIRELARKGVVDSCFPDYVQQGDFSVSIMSHREYDQVPQMLALENPVSEPVNLQQMRRIPDTKS